MVNIVLSRVPLLPASRCLQMHGADICFGEIASALSGLTGIPVHSLMLISDGHAVEESMIAAHGTDDCAFFEVRLRRALPGGKGGFGAMLRGSNASKKTTNLGACRDLSGRRLRDLEREKEIANVEVSRRNEDRASSPAAQIARAPCAHEPPEPQDSVDVDEVREDIRAAMHVVEDAVAEGLRTARLRKRKGLKGKVSKKSKNKRPHDEASGQTTSIGELDTVSKKRMKV